MTCFERYTINKRALPTELILVQCGDFHETFGNDAILLSKLFNIPLTHRRLSESQSVAICGIVYHQLDHYLNKLHDMGIAATTA